MAYTIPTLAELYAGHLARFESEIGQDSPLNDKAFLRVLSAVEAGLDIGHYKYAADAALQSFALTATNSGLDRIGLDNNTPRKQAVTAILEAELPAVAGTIIPARSEFTSDSSGIRYRTTEAATADAFGVATLSLRSVVIGTDGNLDNAETLSISAQIAGAETVATVTDTLTLGVNQETDAEYRPRVLFAQRAIAGGANATDHKIWAEAVTGVRRAFPYAGRPTYAGTSYPGDRTVYVEAVTTVDPDGIPPLALLADVRADINTDPDTGLSRLVLGLTDATLWVEPITRTEIYVEVRDLDIDAGVEAACKADIETALELYLLSARPFIDGVDVVQERNDTISSLSVSRVVQDVLLAYGGFAQGIGFGLAPGVFLSLHYLNPGELVKLGAVSYI